MHTLKLTKKYKTYSEYKDSGVEWLGKIPKDWKLDNIQHLFTKVKRLGFENEELLSVYRDRGVIIKSSREDNHNKASEDLSLYQLVNQGDLAINKMKAWQGSIAISEHKGIVSPAYFICKPLTKNDSRFMHYLLRSGVYIKQYERNSGGVRNDQWDLNYERFRKLEIAIPEIINQTRIAKYLDEKIISIDQIVDKKEKLIISLKEKRTSVVNNLISNAQGEKGKLKNYVQLNPSKKGVFVSGPEDMVSFVPMEAISELGTLELQERKYKDVSSGFTYFKNGDVVLAKITPCYENGKAGVMKGLKNDFGFGTTEFMVLRPSNMILADYLYYVIFSDKFRKMGEVEMRGTAGQKRVTSSFVMNYELSIPDIKTQENIIAELNKKMKMFDVATAKVETSISYLKEFKTSLISNVVTGKIKV